MWTLALTPSHDEKDSEARNDHKEGDTAQEIPLWLQYQWTFPWVTSEETFLTLIKRSLWTKDDVSIAKKRGIMLTNAQRSRDNSHPQIDPIPQVAPE